MPSEKLTDIVDRLSDLTVIEAAELAKMLEEKWGVSGQITGPVTGIVTNEVPVVAEPVQTEFAVILTGFGDKKIPVMREVRTIMGLDLKSASNFMNELPKAVKEDVSRTEADRIKEVIEGAGGTVTIQ